MAKTVWALDLGDWSIKVARGHYDKTSGKMVLELYDEIRFDLLDVEQDATAIEKYRVGLQAFNESYTLSPSDDLCVAVSGSEVFSRFINLPPVPESISEIITYEARQQIPFDIDDVVWDYQPLKEEHQPGEEIEVGLFALKRETIDEFMELLEPWRQNLCVIQDGPLAVYNFLVFEERTDDPIAVLDMGARSTDVLVVNHPQFWIRPLLIGANSVTERLQSHFGVSWGEAERIKERASEKERQAQLLRVVRPVVGNMLSEIQRSLGYYKSLSKGVRIDKILAVGNAFKLKGLDKVLSDGLQYDVKCLTALNNFDLENSVDAESFRKNIGGATTCLGLLVQGAEKGHIGINLVPPELAAARALEEKKPFILGAGVALVMVLAILWGVEMMFSSKLSGNMGVGEDVVQQVEQMERKYEEAQREAEEAREKVEDVADRKIERDFLLEIIPPIARALPDERVFVQDMECVWMSESEYEQAVEERDIVFGSDETEESSEQDRGSSRGRRSRSQPSRPEEERSARRGSGDEQDSRRDEREYSRPTGMESDAEAEHGESSILVLKLSCESTVVSQALEYVENEVEDPLSEVTYAGDGVSILEEVHLVGRPKNVFRDNRSGEVVSEPDEDDEVTQFVAFDIIGQVNVEQEDEESRSSDEEN